MHPADEQRGVPAAGTPELILHHYDRSPFSEKIRLIFGLKGLAWRPVVQPMAPPKPALTPLTGGFRRIPALQIGADLYRDTNPIAAELALLHSEPRLGDVVVRFFKLGYELVEAPA